MTEQLKKILTPFLKAGLKVLNELTNITFHKNQVYPHKGNKSIGDVKIEISVIGDIETKVIFDMSKEFAFKIAKIMLGEIEESSEILQDAVLESGNMIAGNAMGFLEEFMVDCDIKPPTAIIGSDVKVFSEDTQIGVIEFNSKIGNFNIYVITEEPVSKPTGILLNNIPEIITTFLVDHFIPRGLTIYSMQSEADALKAIENQKDIVLLFMNTIYSSKSNIAELIKKVKEVRPNIYVICYSKQSDWDNQIVHDFPNTVLGYIPRAFDTAKTAQVIVMVLNKIGVRYNQKRKHIRIKISAIDNISAILYKGLSGETENILNAAIEDISVGGALLTVPLNEVKNFQEGTEIPRCHLKLKGFVVRAKAVITKKIDNNLAVQFVDILDDDIKKISHFIHEKLRDVVNREINFT